MRDDELTLNRSLVWILVSMLLISGSAFMGWHYYLHVREMRFKDHQFDIVAIVQRTPHSESLKTAYLAELLGLSFDRPKNLYQVNTKEAERLLLNCPVVKKAAVQKIFPGTLCIHYRMYHPAAYLADLSNTAVDREGAIFPFRPFFSPKRLPTFFLGLDGENVRWGENLSEKEKVQWAFDILHQFSSFPPNHLFVKKIDLSQIDVNSYGQRQIVVTLEELSSDWIEASSPKREIFLRLNPNYYKQNIANFRALYEAARDQRQPMHWEGKSIVVDFRIAHLALVK
jgi:hypothetical protein